MKSLHLLDNMLERVLYYSTHIFLKSLQVTSYLINCIGWCFNKSGPILLNWSNKLKSYTLEMLSTEENNTGEFKEVSPKSKDIDKPSRSERQSDWEGKRPKVQLTPLSTDIGSPETSARDIEQRFKILEVTEPRTNGTEETNSQENIPKKESSFISGKGSIPNPR